MPARLSKKKYKEVLSIAKKLTIFLDVEELLDQILNFTKIIFIY